MGIKVYRYIGIGVQNSIRKLVCHCEELATKQYHVGFPKSNSPRRTRRNIAGYKTCLPSGRAGRSAYSICHPYGV